MKLAKLLLLIFVNAFFVNAQASDSLNCKPRKMYLEVSGGRGGFLFDDPYMYLDPSGIRNNYNISIVNSTQLNFGLGLLNKDCKIREGVDHFLYVGMGLTYFNYSVNLDAVDYKVQSHTGTTTHKYEFNNLALNVNKLNYSLFANMGAQFPRGFYISNSLGISYATYLNKKEVSYNEQVTYSGFELSPEYVTPTNPYGYHEINTIENFERKEKNYLENKFNLSYSLQFGYKIKNLIPYGGAEMNYIDEGSASIYVFKFGLRILL